MDDLTPQQIVDALDKYIIGQFAILLAALVVIVGSLPIRKGIAIAIEDWAQQPHSPNRDGNEIGEPPVPTNN